MQLRLERAAKLDRPRPCRLAAFVQRRDADVNIRVRWWTKPQRTYEVRTRAAVILAIKAGGEEAGITLPADTKISFANTPLLIGEGKGKNPRKKKPSQIAKDEKAAQAELAKPADEAFDPEAEKPKPGELNEACNEVPR